MKKENNFVRNVPIVRDIFICKGSYLDGVVYSSKNLILQIAKKGDSDKKVVILGRGYSLSVNSHSIVTERDPLLIKAEFSDLKEFDNNTTVICAYFPFECSGLQDAGKELADCINCNLESGNNLDDYFNLTNYEKQVVLIGHSKCGVCFANATQWIKHKLNIVTISTPFIGTKMVDSEEILQNVNYPQSFLYGKIFSNHNVDKDIKPGSSFIKLANYEGLERNNHVNIVSTCTTSFNPVKIFMPTVNRIVNEGCGDGVVSENSQMVSCDRINQQFIESFHGGSLVKGIRVAKRYIEALN